MKISTIIKLAITGVMSLVAINVVLLFLNDFNVGPLIMSLGIMLVSLFTLVVLFHKIRAMNKLVFAMRELADGNLDGNLNVNIERSKITNDEVGELTQSTLKLVDTIKSIAQDLKMAQHEIALTGDIEYRIDENKYSGAYRDAMQNANAIVDSFVNDLDTIMNKVQGDADGVADQVIPVFPGKKRKYSDSLQVSEDILMDIYHAIVEISESTVNGSFDKIIDTSKFKGAWLDMFGGLNNIVKAVNEPLQVIRIALIEMKNGNVDLDDIDGKITAQGHSADTENYSGIFKEVFLAFNETIISLHSYIDEIKLTLSQVAEGDLRCKIDREYLGSFDIIKRSINIISSSLHKTMSEISTASEQVLSGAGQISNSATQLATGAQEQASSVEELNTTIDLINEQTQQNADNALSAKELSNKSANNAQEGNEAMKQTMEAMTQIKESSGNISKIIKTIQDIAFQTNLLALNASVEAARAGEEGKGFAVVADEVRSLSGRSQNAVNETTTLIQDSIERVEVGSSIVETTADSLDAILTSAGEVSEIIDGISASSKEQAEAIANISEGLSEIAQVTQTNSAISEETAAASEELNSQAEVLRQLVSFFRL